MAWNENQTRVINWRNSNILVSAAAGSGKTAALVERIIKLVIEDEIDINRLIVVTFTKAAASEMKERLSASLYKALEQLDIDSLAGADSDDTEEKRIRLENQINLVNTAQICTIDSFCQYIIKNYFYAVEGLDPGFRVVDQDEERILLSDTLDDILESKYSDENNLEFQQLAEAFSSWKNDEGLKETILSIYNKSVTLPQPQRWLEQLVSYYDVSNDNWDELYNPDYSGYKGCAGSWLESIIDYIRIRISDFIDCAELAKELLSATGFDELIDILDDDIIKLGRIYDATNSDTPYESVKKALERVIFGIEYESDGTQVVHEDQKFREWKRFSAKSYGDDKDSFYDAKSCRVYTGSESLLVKYYSNYFDLSNVIKMMSFEGLDASDSTCVEIIRNRCGKLYPFVRSFVDIVKELDDTFQRVKNESGIVDFNDMEHFALKILTCEDADGSLVPSDIARELGGYYKQIMIDEYQDSNLVQEEILSSIAKGARLNAIESGELAADSNDSVRPYMFMVGDVKQSIYSFRYARPELFMQKYKSYEAEKNYVDADEAGREGKSIRIVLDRNYRSRINVLQQVNNIFEKLMTENFGGIEYDDSASLKYGGLYDEADNAMLQNTETDYSLYDYNTELLLVESNNRKDLFPDLNDIDTRWMDNHYSLYELEAMSIGNRILEMVQPERAVSIKEMQGEEVDKKPFLVSDSKDGIQIKRPARFKDIVILLRSAGKEGSIYRNVLTKMGIPVSAEGKTGYFDAVEVQIVMNYLKIIDNPDQDIPLVSVLKSSFVGLSDDELAQIEIETKVGRPDYYERLLAFSVKEYESDDMKALSIKVKAFVEGLETYREAARYSSVYDILVSLYYGENGFYDICAAQSGGEQRTANLDALLQRALTYSSSGNSNRSILDFTHYIETLRKKEIDYGEADTNDENADVVRIMTIHKSKGLEFPIVFLGMTGKKFNDMDTKSKVVSDNDYGMAMDDFNFDSRLKSDWVYKKFIAGNLRRNAKAEEQRVLYVALTRAKEKLIISGIMDFTAKMNKTLKTPEDAYNKKFEDYFGGFRTDYITRLINAEEMSNYYKWIISAIYGNRAFELAREKYRLSMIQKIHDLESYAGGDAADYNGQKYIIPGICIADNEIKKDMEEKDCLTVSILSNEMVVKMFENAEKTASQEESTLESSTESVAIDLDELKEVLNKQLSFHYPFENKKRYPAKVSVSALKAASHEQNMVKVNASESLDDGVAEQQVYTLIQDEEYEDIAFDHTIPSFMKEESGKIMVPANELGTTFHKLMEMMPFDNIDSVKTIEQVTEYIRRLSQKQNIMETHADYIISKPDYIEYIRAFTNSDSKVLKGMINADTKGRLHNEQPFMKEYDSYKLTGIKSIDGNTVDTTDGESDNHRTIVQGVIDAFYVDDDGEIVLIDYKTDGISGSRVTENILADRYRIQFDYYTEALESLTGLRVKERYIYSFKLKKFILI